MGSEGPARYERRRRAGHGEAPGARRTQDGHQRQADRRKPPREQTRGQRGRGGSERSRCDLSGGRDQGSYLGIGRSFVGG